MASKTLIAGMAFAACGLASAQTSLTLFGVVDAAVQHGSGSIANRNQLGSGGLNASRLGFRGTEQLTGGMWAGFWLEAGLNEDNGTGTLTNTNNQASGAPASLNGAQGMTFSRRSTVSLGGDWGEIRVGRDYTPQYMNIKVYDPTDAVGVGTAVNVTNIITGPTSQRASNTVTYFSPKVGGFFGEVQYYFGENASNAANKDDGNGGGIRVGYGSGPIEFAVATSRTDYLAGNSRQSNVGGQYDFGFAKVLANYSRDEGLVQVAAAPVPLATAKAKGWSLGAIIPHGSNEFKLGYSRYSIDVVDPAFADPQATKFMASWNYRFSKRTAVYTTVAHVRTRGGSATALLGAVTGPNENSAGYEVGLRHSF
ncbi:MAG: gram-negative porin family protein [Ramlibacter sp.]|nr:gram-negative porin family protein [Ramlibacter sp.]